MFKPELSQAWKNTAFDSPRNTSQWESNPSCHKPGKNTAFDSPRDTSQWESNPKCHKPGKNSSCNCPVGGPTFNPREGRPPLPPPSCGGQRPPRSRVCQRRPAARRGRPRDASPSISPSARNVVAGANGILKVPTPKLLPSLSSFVGTTAFSYLLSGRPL